MKFAVAACSLAAAVSASGNFNDASALTKEDAESTLLAELVGKLRPGAQNDRIAQFENELRSMYAALPKSANGGLEHSVVRYALHRLLVQRHGWYIKGLEPDSDAKSKEVAARLKEWVPSYLQTVLEKRTGGRGFDLSELAAVAATLEDLIHNEAINRLKYIYEVMGLSTEQAVNAQQATDLLDMFTMAYVRGGNFSANSPDEAALRLGMFKKKYTGWKEVAEWVQQLHANITGVNGVIANDEQLDFNEATRVAEAIGAKYHQFNDIECGDLKTTLLGIEDKKPGRVKLSQFYKMGLHTHWQFTEKPDYLRTLGALDESDPDDLKVIVPNYVGARPQCLEASGFYAVCCRNECEDIMAGIEAEVAEPTAMPDRIVELVSKMTSDTVLQPRTLSESLVTRLKQVANANGGRVPLHGRLFAQWMHHVFPRECPFPHVGGTANPETPDEWMRRTGQGSIEASEEEMMNHVKVGGTVSNVASDELPWADEEELLVELLAPPPTRPKMQSTWDKLADERSFPTEPHRGLFNQQISSKKAATDAAWLNSVLRLLRTLTLVAVALGLAVASKTFIPEASGEPRKSQEQLQRGKQATMALLLFPLAVVCFDYFVDWSSSKELLLCGLCWGLAAMIIIQLHGQYGHLGGKHKGEDEAYEPERTGSGVNAAADCTSSLSPGYATLKKRSMNSGLPEV